MAFDQERARPGALREPRGVVWRVWKIVSATAGFRWRPARLPRALKLFLTAYVVVLVPVYWRVYGPGNFLWFSDIALFATTLAAWRERALAPSMMAVGVLPLEVAWTGDFLSGGRLLNLAGYMFDANQPLYLRGLSLFHLAIPPALVLMLARLGYDRRALRTQTVFAWAVLLATWLLTAPEKNVNWVYGWGTEPQRAMPRGVYLALLMAVLPVAVFVPMHLALRRLFPAPDRASLTPSGRAPRES